MGLYDTEYPIKAARERLSASPKAVEGAPDAPAAPVQDVRVYHCRPHVPVPEQLLDRSDVVARFKKVSRKTVTQCVRTCGFGDLPLANRRLHRLLDDRFMKVMSAFDSSFAVEVERGGRKDVLPVISKN